MRCSVVLALDRWCCFQSNNLSQDEVLRVATILQSSTWTCAVLCLWRTNRGSWPQHRSLHRKAQQSGSAFTGALHRIPAATLSIIPRAAKTTEQPEPFTSEAHSKTAISNPNLDDNVYEESSDLEEEQPDDIEAISDFSDSPRIDPGGTTWGVKALDIARRVLEDLQIAGLELYAFHAIPRGGLLDIRLDQLEDIYGSPTLDQVEAFAKGFYSALEAELGEEEAGRISVEVSSPGAEREVKLPQELKRFKDLPMTVTYLWLEAGSEKKDTRVLQIVEDQCTEDVSVWQLANVKLNRPQGRPNLTKRQAAERLSIPYANIAKANLFIEI